MSGQNPRFDEPKPGNGHVLVMSPKELVGPDGETWHENHPFLGLRGERSETKTASEIERAVFEMLD